MEVTHIGDKAVWYTTLAGMVFLIGYIALGF